MAEIKTHTPDDLFSNCDLEYCQIAIEDFDVQSGHSFDIYVKINDNKYVLVHKKNETINQKLIQNYQARNINHVYLTRKDYAEYIDFKEHFSEEALQAESIKKRKDIIVHSLQIIQEIIHKVASDNESLVKTGMQFHSSLITLTHDIYIENILSNLVYNNPTLYRHSVAVGLIAAAISRKMQITSPALVSKVILGCLLHDIALSRIPDSEYQKGYAYLYRVHPSLMNEHSNIGLEEVQKAKHLDPAIYAIIEQHHEKWKGGGGIPGRRKGQRIHPLARIVCLAERICDLTLNSNLSLVEAIQSITLEEPDSYDPQALVALMKFSNYSVPPYYLRKIA